ncbi:MAG TPA: hypothetical protein VGU03_13855 [Frateuria sp.]|uniref:hypothetical protein n=1 Tax=Frateuria sp. TaxID=2211372 RepID=UPI002DE74D69|nr:hypothetical protein [Frateuria sp.]
MKFETLLLRSLFVACLLACGWIMGAMLFTPGPVQLAGTGGARIGALLAAPAACMLPPDGVVCPRQDS